MARLGIGGSVADPYSISEITDGPGYNVIDGRTQIDPRLAAGETTGVFILAGQSNSPGANYVDAAYTSTNTTKNNTLHIYNGAVYQTADPLLGGGSNVGSWGGRLADKLIDAGIFQRVILVPAAIGGTTVASWEPGGVFTGNQPNALFGRLAAATRRCLAHSYTISGYIWVQGEADFIAGTSQAAYMASFNNMFSSLRAFGAGFDAPWFVGLCTYGGGTTSATIRAAQAALVDGVSIFQGGDADNLTGTTVYRQAANNIHLTAAGADAAADLWKAALDAVF